MKYVVMLLVLSGCATVPKQPKLIDPNNRSQSQRVIDSRSCTKFIYGMGNVALDQEYYDACMDLKGYKYEMPNE
jgi:hypothetical protein